jgi:predicted nuclease of predicted toxin-antitoxin system
MRRVLIDECINPRLAPRLRTALPDDVVETVRDLGWAGQRDHILVPQIQGQFDVFLTIDKGFEFEHNLEKLSFGVIVLQAANNQMRSYERLLEELVQRIQSAGPGQVVRVSDPEL